MRREYREQFVASAIGVLEGVIRSNVTHRQASPGQGDTSREEIAIAVRLVGAPGGLVLLRMNTATAVNICARLHETDFRSLTPLAVDTLSELANMIAGHAAGVLNNQGFNFTLSTPHFGSRENSSDISMELEGFRIPLTTDCGDVTIQVALKAH